VLHSTDDVECVREHRGYARVEIDQAIARCDERCPLTVYLKPSAAGRGGGRESFKI
jgi:hypothetical protein